MDPLLSAKTTVVAESRELAPPRRIRLLGQGLSLAIARTPWLWPVLRGPTRRFWERSAHGWDERIRPDRPEHLAPLVAASERLESEPGAILEVGTGTGSGALMLAGRFPGARVRGVDISPAMIEVARRKVPEARSDRVAFDVADADSLPYEEAAFDLIAQLNVPVYLDEVARVLAPGGHLVVASSLGPSTPYFTPSAVLRRACAKRGLEPIAEGGAAAGTYFLARRPADAEDAASAPVRRFYDKTAAKYDRQIKVCERLLFGEGRQWVCSQAAGDVLELAVGTGRNLRHYPPGVRLVGIELSPAMLDIAQQEAATVGREADLRVGDAQALEFPDDSFDTVTCTLALCTIPDDRAALAEAIRVLRPGGRFVAMEHVRSPALPVRAVQRMLEPLFVRFEHDHLLRDPLDHLEAVGFEVERVERSKVGIVERVAARKPGGGDGGAA